jgi:hypothetical protein
MKRGRSTGTPTKSEAARMAACSGRVIRGGLMMKERREFQLSKAASAALDRLADSYKCNYSDAIEGLLLGTVDSRAAADGLSVSEIPFYQSVKGEIA